MSRRVIVTVAPTGGSLQKSQNPSVPTQPEEIAAEVLACVEAGASVAALHVRTATDEATCDPAVYRRVNELLRESSDVVLNNSTGGGVSGDMTAPLGDGMLEISWPQRLAATEGGGDVLTLDAITAWAFAGGREVLMNTSPTRSRELAQRIRSAGAKPEWEVFNPAHLAQDIPWLIAAGADEPPHAVNLVVGLDGVFTNALPYEPRLLELMVDMLPSRSVFSVSAVGPDPFTPLSHALALGGHIRVGLEDSPFAPDGSPHRNLDLVRRAVELVREHGLEPATPAQARELLGLPVGVRI